jgi:hypothetical protein
MPPSRDDGSLDGVSAHVVREEHIFYELRLDLRPRVYFIEIWARADSLEEPKGIQKKDRDGWVSFFLYR